MSRILRRHFLHTLGAGMGSLYGGALLNACSSDEGQGKGAGTMGDDTVPNGEDAGAYVPLIAEPGEPWWLMGNYAPVDEEREAFDLDVEGALPMELDGVYVRNGPNPIHGTAPHWFFGDGMMHGVRIRGGKAEWYRNKYVETTILGRSPDEPLIPLAADHPSNTAFIQHAGKLLSLAETGFPYEISPTDLSTVGPYNYEGALAGAMTAHPKVDPETGEMIAFGYAFEAPFLTYHQIDAQGTLVRSEPIDVPQMSMMHDCAITKNYVIFIDVPVVFNLDLLDTGFPFGWSDDLVTRLGVMPRDGSNADVVWLEIEPCMIVHTMNAQEMADGTIVLEAARLPDLFRGDSRDFNNSPQLHRFTIDLQAKTVVVDQLDDRVADFPQLNRTRLGLSYRYGYAMRFGEFQGDQALKGVTDIIKYDLERESSEVIALAEGEHADEVVFIPAAGAVAEDDGYLMGFAHDARTEESYVAVYDARQMERIARINIPFRVPAGFHGLWVPS